MTVEAGFIQGILAAPHDDCARLVYADWLEEHADPRAEYLRLQCELVRTWSFQQQRTDLFARIAELCSGIDPGWLALVQRCTTPPPPVNVEDAIPVLKGRAKTTVRLHPRAGRAAVDESKIGGTFLWPAELDDAWPRCLEHDCPLVTALQLRQEDVPEVSFPPGADLFQVLWCPHYVHERGTGRGPRGRGTETKYGPAPEVYWWKRSDITNPVKFHPQPSGEDLIDTQSCVLHPERVLEYPDICELEDELGRSSYRFGRWQEPEALSELHKTLQVLTGNRRGATGTVAPAWQDPDTPSWFYQSWLSTAPATKVGGYPDWLHCPEYPKCSSCSSRMELLVNFSSCEFDAVSWGRWLPIEDRHVLIGDGKQNRAVQAAAGWCFGDAGTLYLFICRCCKRLRTEYGMQCS